MQCCTKNVLAHPSKGVDIVFDTSIKDWERDRHRAEEAVYLMSSPDQVQVKHMTKAI